MARLALVIGNGTFDDAAAFPRLRTPANDARDVAATLRRHGGFEIVGTPIDASAAELRSAVEDLYAQAERGDLTLLYYSGHGTKDRGGRHFLAARDTRAERLLSTGIKESFLREAMEHSASRHRVVILDCCFSGAFTLGRKAGAEPLLLEQLRGEASAVLASSSAIQYSFEESGRNSLFTRHLLEGIEQGYADEDEDDAIGLEELFAYADRHVRAERPEQTPLLEHRARDSKIVLATNPKPRVRPADLPADLREALVSANATYRLGAAVRLAGMLDDSDPGRSLAARLALAPLVHDDSREVSGAARAALAGDDARGAPEAPSGRESNRSARAGTADGGEVQSARAEPPAGAAGSAASTPPANDASTPAAGSTAPAVGAPPPTSPLRRLLRRLGAAASGLLGANIVVVALFDPYTGFGSVLVGVGFLVLAWGLWPRS